MSIRVIKPIAVFFFALFAAGCQPEDTGSLGRADPRLTGTWRLFERAGLVDTTYTVKAVPQTPAQTLTFTSEGGVVSTGTETEYYSNVSFYRLDSVQRALQITLGINKRYKTFQQGLTLRRDTLYLLPPCGQACYLAFVRSR